MSDGSTHLPVEITNAIEAAYGRIAVGATPLGDPKRIPDATSKVLVRDRTGLPLAVVIYGRFESAALVRRNMCRATSIKRSLGTSSLAIPILLPFASTDVGDTTYAAYRYCPPLARSGLHGVLHRWLVSRPVLSWLRAIIEATSARASLVDIKTHFMAPIELLLKTPGISPPLKQAAKTTIGRLASGQWVAYHVVTHFDLWTGNILFDCPRRLPQVHDKFVIIDWAGSTMRGYGIYDLLRLCESLRSPSGTLMRELRSHCSILHCDLIDARSHLIAALGHLRMHLEHFALSRFLSLAHRCMSSLDMAIDSK